MPIAFSGDTASIDSILTESTGLKLEIKVTPKMNKQGGFIGNQVDYKAIAKPTNTTTTTEVQAAHVRTTTNTDSTKKTEIRTETKASVGLASWVWWVIAIVAVVILLIFVKPIFNKLKSWISIF